MELGQQILRRKWFLQEIHAFWQDAALVNDPLVIEHVEYRDKIEAGGRKAITESAPSAAAKRKDIPIALDNIIKKALSVDPADRYQSAGEVVQALDRIIRGEGGPLATGAPVLAEPEAPAAAFSPPARSRCSAPS